MKGFIGSFVPRSEHVDIVIARAQQKVPGWIAAYNESYGGYREQDSIPEEEHAAGLLSGAEYAEIVEKCEHCTGLCEVSDTTDTSHTR